MTPALRKRHQRTWWFLGLALLLIWGTSMVAINKNKVSKNHVQTVLAEDITIAVKNGTVAKTQIISLQIRHPFSSPQTLVYLTKDEVDSIGKSQLLGRIDGAGTFEFALDSISATMPKKVIKGYDAIHQQELFSEVLDN